MVWFDVWIAGLSIKKFKMVMAGYSGVCFFIRSSPI